MFKSGTSNNTCPIHFQTEKFDSFGFFLRLLVWFKAWDINYPRHFAFNYYLNYSYRLCGLLTYGRDI